MDISGEILKKAARGDIAAFEDVYRDTSGFVYSVALRTIGNTQEAQDVTQEVYVKLFKNLRKFDFKSAFRTWLYRVTVNTALNKCKTLNRDASKRAGLEVTDIAAPVERSMDYGIEAEDNRRQISSILNKLNPEQRECIMLREVEGLSYKEIAEALGSNINTVRTRLKRARETLMARQKEVV